MNGGVNDEEKEEPKQCPTKEVGGKEARVWG